MSRLNALWHPFDWFDDQLEKLSARALGALALVGFYAFGLVLEGGNGVLRLMVLFVAVRCLSTVQWRAEEFEKAHRSRATPKISTRHKENKQTP